MKLLSKGAKGRRCFRSNENPRGILVKAMDHSWANRIAAFKIRTISYKAIDKGPPTVSWGWMDHKSWGLIDDKET
jgi:hypothetical protein